MTDNDLMKVGQAVGHIRKACYTTSASTCTSKMAGYLHGLMKELAFVPKNLQYAVLEVVFGCEIYSFTLLRFDTCKALIDMMNENPDARATFYTISDAIQGKVGKDHVCIPGEFKDFLYACEEESIYAF